MKKRIPPKAELAEMESRLAPYRHDDVICLSVEELRSVVEGCERAHELDALVNSPHTDEFFEAVRTERAHQVERWGTDHDAGKTPADWYWLLGWLAGKAVHSAITGNAEKALHHVITTAAACVNWHAQLSGVSNRMRPGIDTPKGEAP